MKIELLKLGVQVITLIITAYVAPAFIRWLNQRSEDAKMERVKGWARHAVLAAEQIYRDYKKSDPNGTKRYERAFDTIQRINGRYGLGLTDTDIRILIEAAVMELNGGGAGPVICLQAETDPEDNA